MSDHDHVIAAYFAAVNQEDWPALRALLADDAELRAVGTWPRIGHDAVIAFYQGLFLAWNTHDDTPTRILPSGTSATVEVRFTGTTRSDGRSVVFDAIDVFDFADGRIARLTNWYDIAFVRAQLADASTGV